MSILLTSCVDLDLNPLSEGSSENWYSNEEELTMSIRFLYADKFWQLDDDAFTDDWTSRYDLNSITNGTLDGTSSTIINKWSSAYEGIAAANEILSNLGRAREHGTNEPFVQRIEGEARLVRAEQYSRLVSHFGDVVLVMQPIDYLEDAFNRARTDKRIVLDSVYNDFDIAASLLEKSYTGESRGTKGMAYAFKARAALYNGDYEIAAKAAKDCIDLGVYKLEADFSNLFLMKTKSSNEFIYVRPRADVYGIYFGATAYISRTSGGWAQNNPSWDLFCSFLCTDGKPIDKSSLYNPQKPFENRDPRCSKTIVEFETAHLGFIYDPHPMKQQVLNVLTNKNVSNLDNRVNNQYASYNGLLFKKWIDASWLENSRRTDKSEIIMRYADVLLMYAEAKIELNQIDESVIDAINTVRARAYGVDKSATLSYPTVTTMDQKELRKIVRIERRMELAFEGLRYMDIIRWRIAGKALNIPTYGMLDPVDLISKVVNPGLWFFPGTPEIDDDGIPDFAPMYNAGLIKLLAQRKFDVTRQYLWPIPSKEILINDKLTQNPNY
jgi:hypothetical protein